MDDINTSRTQRGPIPRGLPLSTSGRRARKKRVTGPCNGRFRSPRPTRPRPAAGIFREPGRNIPAAGSAEKPTPQASSARNGTRSARTVPNKVRTMFFFCRGTPARSVPLRLRQRGPRKWRNYKPSRGPRYLRLRSTPRASVIAPQKKLCRAGWTRGFPPGNPMDDHAPAWGATTQPARGRAPLPKSCGQDQAQPQPQPQPPSVAPTGRPRSRARPRSNAGRHNSPYLLQQGQPKTTQELKKHTFPTL